jgi:hypothetical protein
MQGIFRCKHFRNEVLNHVYRKGKEVCSPKEENAQGNEELGVSKNAVKQAGQRLAA